MVQLAPWATEVPQLLLCEKSPLLVPPKEMLVMFKVALPLFDSVTVWAGVVLPSDWLPKARLPGDRPTAGAVPTPVRVTV